MNTPRLPITALLLTSSALAFGAVACGSDGSTFEEPTPEPVVLPTPEPFAPEQTAEEFCAEAEAVYQAEREPANVLFLLDRSGSMQIKLSNNETRWVATKRGLFEMMANLPASTVAGAMMFPQGDAPVNCCEISPQTNNVVCNCPSYPPEAPRCTQSTYSVGVASAPLDGAQVSAIQSYVSASDNEFYLGTPLRASLLAAIEEQQNSKAPGARSVVLLTDGNPLQCGSVAPYGNDIDGVIEAAAQGVNGKPSVRTFVMGVLDGDKGAHADKLSPIAKAGGTARSATCDQTNDCFYAINAQSFVSDIKQAFQEIELQAFDCIFNLPEAEGADKAKVNVQVKSPGGDRVVSRDPNRKDGWDYLPSGNQIQLYGAACRDLKADASAKVEIVLGCETRTLPVK